MVCLLTVNHMVPHTVKEAVVVIKPSTEKNKSNKKEKVCLKL